MRDFIDENPDFASTLLAVISVTLLVVYLAVIFVVML